MHASDRVRLQTMPVRALARVNVAAIERNVARLRSVLRGGAGLCAVVKGDGYGHGAVQSAHAALRGGAGRLAVASAEEAFELRRAQIEAPILVMGALSDQELEVALAADADVVAWSARFITQAARLAERERERAARIHVKLDSGMGRLGTRDPREAIVLAEQVLRAGPALELVGVMTHFATADSDLEFTAAQLQRFRPVAARLRELVPGLVVHAANSAGTLREPTSHFDFVRCGIAIYGCDPMNEDPAAFGLEPALELQSYVAAVKAAARGDSAGYGRRFIAQSDTSIGTIPIGYADGVRRALTNNCDVLIRARRYPLVGTVSMDNLTVDLGPEPQVHVGDVATLIGRDGAERQTAEDIARRLGTINYEVVCGISARVPRAYHRDGEPT